MNYDAECVTISCSLEI